MTNLMQMAQTHDRFVKRTVPFLSRDRHMLALALATRNTPAEIGGKLLLAIQDIEFVASLVDIPRGWLSRETTAWFDCYRLEVCYGVPLVRPKGRIGIGVDAGALEPKFLRKYPRLGKLVLALQWAATTMASTRPSWGEARKSLQELFGDRQDGVLLGSHRFARSLVKNYRRWEPSFYLAVPVQTRAKVWAAVIGEGSWGNKYGTIPLTVGQAFVDWLIENGQGGWLQSVCVEDRWWRCREHYGKTITSAIEQWFWSRCLMLDHLLYVPGKYAAHVAPLASPDELVIDVTGLQDFFMEEESTYLVPPLPAPRYGDRYRITLGEIDLNLRPHPIGDAA